VPSFLKALYISSADTIFDDEAVFNAKSLTNSAEHALSAPEALKLRMQELSRSKSALGASSSNPPML